MDDQENSERILVGVDGSPSSIEALRRGARIAKAFDAPLEAVTTWEFPTALDGFYYPAPEWSPESDAHQILSTAVEQAFPDGPPDKFTTTTLQGAPARVLITESEHAGMLVLGSRGHGGFAGLLLGSVSGACAEHAHCPVLIMHSKDAKPE
ncbi:universal stress protein [Lysinimonas soli]|uniref:Universal stress protein n=1 Tax=Lysinimonas soli TaxID=1074233 RepID=A0ABW0NRF3_9MICO